MTKVEAVPTITLEHGTAAQSDVSMHWIQRALEGMHVHRSQGTVWHTY